ncbi:alpha/beta hydrolase [Alteribacillus sp. JSM 102045]|uniref:alpha/beta hydrolase n=1 Tax=Alteribacillus sp. JSM 102045 TaxID=1562101 RepID=UPI0035C0B5AF
MTSPRPVLFIAGIEAETLYFSERAYSKANEPKELFTVENATHFDLYDKEEYINPALEKLNSFFKESL